MTTPNDFLQLIGTDTPHAPGAAYLCATYNPASNPGNPDSFRVHFNLPEGTQRFCGEAGRVKIPRTDLVLLTRFSHETIMGLPGYVLTAQDGVLTGKQKALTGKSVMGTSGGAQGTSAPVGMTNKQKKAEAAASQGNGNALSKTASAGRTFLVGAPVGSTPLVSWWESMTSMYFHYRPQGVIDLAFVAFDSNSRSDDNDNINAASPLLFALALTTDRINGYSNADYNGRTNGNNTTSSNSSGGCCEVGQKRSRSAGAEATANNSDTTKIAAQPLVPPLEVVKLLVAGNASHVVAICTSTSNDVTSSVVSYLCRFPPPSPSFDARVAKEVFGVRPGPKFGVLKGGGAVDSDTMFGPDGVTPLRVTLDDIVKAAAEEGQGAGNSRSQWNNVLILDGDDENTILAALKDTLDSIRTILSLGSRGELGPLTVLVILCPNTVSLSETFTTKIAALFGPKGPLPLRVVSGRQGVLSADDIENRSYIEASDRDISANAISAFPTALAHRMHLSSLAATYFPLASCIERCTQENAAREVPPSCAPLHPLTLGMADKVWWPYSLLYKLVDGSCINTPRIAEYNKALEEEIRMSTTEKPPAPAEGSETLTQSANATTTKEKKVAPSKPPVNRDAQEQDPPLRYPTVSTAMEMLSETLCEKVRQHGVDCNFQDLVHYDATSSSSASSGPPSVMSNHMLFLGTGSAVPSKYRNVSGLVVGNAMSAPVAPIHPLLATSRIICDFGEGSLGQWAQFLGPSDQYGAHNFLTPLELALLTVRLVFISHNHADHVLGIFSLLDHYAKVCRKVQNANADEQLIALANRPLLIVCPRNFRESLQKTVPLLCPYAREQCDGGAASSLNDKRVTHSIARSIVALDLEPLTVSSALASSTNGEVNTSREFFGDFLRFHFGPEATATIIPVDHPAHAHALFFRTSPQWSWCYSGDTRPWPLMEAVAATSAFAPLRVLVHECTFDDDLQNEAVYKKHSTLSEALGAGVRCGAEHVLLNHFSQRYPKIPPAAAAAAARLLKRNASIGDANNDPTAGASGTVLPIVPFSFSFDGMLVPFDVLRSGDLESRLPLFQWLLDEYDGWSVGTSQRLRGRREGANANAMPDANKKGK